MPFDFATAKINARRTIHETFGVQAFYSDDSVSDIEMRARWHNKISRPFGDLDNGGYAEIIEGIDRIIFLRDTSDNDDTPSVRDVDGNPIELKRTGEISFPALLPGVVFVLDHQSPIDGPVEETWIVTRREEE